MNICILAGRLTRDPELSYTRNNTPLCKISIAVESWKKDDQGNKIAHFFNCTAWGKPAEAIKQYFLKGDEIKISSEAQLEKWVDKATGANRSQVTFNVRDFWFGAKARGHEGRGAPAPAGSPAPGGYDADANLVANLPDADPFDDFTPPPAGEEEVPF